MSDVTLTEGEQTVLGIRDADCGCCYIVDTTGFREFVAARVAEAEAKALEDAAEEFHDAAGAMDRWIADCLRARAAALRAEGGGDRD